MAAAIKKAAHGLPPRCVTTVPGTGDKGFSELIVPGIGFLNVFEDITVLAGRGSLELRRFDSDTLKILELTERAEAGAEERTEVGRSDSGLTRTALVIAVASRGAFASVISPALFT